MRDQQSFQISDSLLHVPNRSMLNAGKKFEVGNSIVPSVSVFVMDMFMALKRAAQGLRHYEAMFIDFAALVSHRVLGSIKFHITVSRFFQGGIPPRSMGFCLRAGVTTKRMAVIIFMRNVVLLVAIRAFNGCKIAALDLVEFIHKVIMPYPTRQVKYIVQGGET